MHTRQTIAGGALRLVGSAPGPDHTPPESRSVLRLVREAAAPAVTPVPAAQSAARARVASEMQSAAGMSALDARWILAVQAARSLTGGRAAILTPESRRRLATVGERVGLRPFDTSLVIAIVQDAARSGDDELGGGVVDRLRLVHPGPDASSAAGPDWTEHLLPFGLIVLAALTLAIAAVRWILG